MPIRNTDQLEQFQPLGAPIRQEPAKPAPQPEPVGNGLWRSADGKLETRIPPPAISPAQRQGMWQRDTRPYEFNRIKLGVSIADCYFGSGEVKQRFEPAAHKLSPEFLDRRGWQEERNKAVTELVRKLRDFQAAESYEKEWADACDRPDWLKITKQVQDLPAAKDWPPYVRYEPEHRTALQAQRDEIVSKIRKLQERHRLELEPYMQMLVSIDACSLPPRFVTPMDSPNFDFQAIYRARDLPKSG